jgi:hypothetical protein
MIGKTKKNDNSLNYCSFPPLKNTEWREALKLLFFETNSRYLKMHGQQKIHFCNSFS